MASFEFTEDEVPYGILGEYGLTREMVEDLPENPNAGDVWTVEETGNDYLWNGAEWELFSQVITDLQIDAIIDSIS